MADDAVASTSTNVAKLSALAAQVSDLAAEREAAFAAEREAEEKLLEAAILAVKPAWRAFSSRIVESERSTAGRDGCNPVEEKTYHEERGLLLVDGWESVKDESGNRGSYRGTRLYLLDDGRLAGLYREGSWSRWQNEWSGYETTLTVATTNDALGMGDLESIVEAIARALDRQLAGSTVKNTTAAKARAEKMRSIATLVSK